MVRPNLPVSNVETGPSLDRIIESSLCLRYQCVLRLTIAVGTAIAGCPPHRPGRALISASGSYLG